MPVPSVLTTVAAVKLFSSARSLSFQYLKFNRQSYSGYDRFLSLNSTELEPKSRGSIAKSLSLTMSFLVESAIGLYSLDVVKLHTLSSVEYKVSQSLPP